MADCDHPDDASWIDRWANLSAGLVLVEQSCTACGHKTLLEVQALTSGERAWSLRAAMLQKAGIGGKRCADLLLRSFHTRTEGE